MSVGTSSGGEHRPVHLPSVPGGRSSLQRQPCPVRCGREGCSGQVRICVSPCSPAPWAGQPLWAGVTLAARPHVLRAARAPSPHLAGLGLSSGERSGHQLRVPQLTRVVGGHDMLEYLSQIQNTPPPPPAAPGHSPSLIRLGLEQEPGPQGQTLG